MNKVNGKESCDPLHLTLPVQETLKITWSGVRQLADDMAESLRLFKIVRIIGISRGGLIPTAIVAHRLGIHAIHVLCIKSYDENNKPLPMVCANNSIANLSDLNVPQTLVIDDIADSGRTMKVVAQLLPMARRAVLIAKPNGEEFVHYAGQTIGQGTWVHFPWEDPGHL